MLVEDMESNVSIASIQAKFEEGAVQGDQSSQVVIRNELSDIEPYVARKAAPPAHLDPE